MVSRASLSVRFSKTVSTDDGDWEGDLSLSASCGEVGVLSSSPPASGESGYKEPEARGTGHWSRRKGCQGDDRAGEGRQRDAIWCDDSGAWTSG